MEFGFYTKIAGCPLLADTDWPIDVNRYVILSGQVSVSVGAKVLDKYTCDRLTVGASSAGYSSGNRTKARSAFVDITGRIVHRRRMPSAWRKMAGILGSGVARIWPEICFWGRYKFLLHRTAVLYTDVICCN